MMNLFRQRYRAWIVPYVEGTLDARRQAKLEAWLAHDPALAAEAEAERCVTARLRAAAQAAGSTEKPDSLWPSIQARLEPRRPSARPLPLLLVGGLSAATATLVGAALWGPLKPAPPLPVPNPMVASNDPSVIIVVPPSVRKGKRPVHSWHKGSGGGKRPAVYHALPIPDPGIRRDETQPQDLLAVNPVENSDGTGSDGESPAPKFVPNSHNFRLTGNEHPVKTDPAPDTSPADPTGDTNTPSGGGDTAETSSHPAQDTSSDTPPAAASAPSDGAETKQPTTTHHRQRHRRHGHTVHTPTQPASGHEGTASPGTDNANAGQDAAPVPPKTGVKPVD